MRAPGVVRSTAGALAPPRAAPPAAGSATTGTTSCSSARMPDSRSAPPRRRGAQHHRVTGPHQTGHLGGQLGPVPQDGLPAPRLHQRDVRALGGGDQRDDAGPRPGQQPVEGDVQPRGVVALLEAPRGGQGVGQGRLLLQQFAGPVPHPPGLDQDDQGVRAQQVADELLGVGQPGQPRLHAVELVAVGQPVPLVATPRLGPDQAGGPVTHGLVGDQLAAAEQLDGPQVVDGALVGHVEPGQPVDLVAPQVDAHRLVGGGREDVDDPAPHGQLPAVLDDGLASVAHGHQLADQLGHVDAVTLPHDDRSGRGAERAQPLQHRLDGGDHQVRTVAARSTLSAAPAQLPEQSEPPAHGGHVGTDPLEGQRLPGREDLHLPRPAPGGETPPGRGPAARPTPRWG